MYVSETIGCIKRSALARLAGCGLLLLAGLAVPPAGAIAPDDISNPRDEDFRVADVADRLSPSAERLLDDTIDAFERETKREMVVVIVPDAASSSPEELAAELRDRWKIGQDVKDLGILMLISAEDRQIAVDFGSNLSPAWRKLDRLLTENALPELENDNYDLAALAGVEAVIEATSLSPENLFAFDFLIKVGTVVVIARVVQNLVIGRRAKAQE